MNCKFSQMFILLFKINRDHLVAVVVHRQPECRSETPFQRCPCLCRECRRSSERRRRRRCRCRRRRQRRQSQRRNYLEI